MKSPTLRKGFKIWLIAAVAITLIACNTPSYKTWIEKTINNPSMRALELDLAAKQSEGRAFGTNTEEKASIPEPAKPDINAVSSVGEILTEQWVVNVFQGIVTSFSQPPLICYANYFEYPSTECSISYSAEKIVPYQHSLSIPEAGSTIQLDVKGPYSAIGVQLWGDYADGWALVSVDDIPVWKGYTKFENCEFVDGVRFITEETCEGGFFYYVEIDGLQGNTHTLKVTNLGGGETTITHFGLGKVKR